MHDVADRLFSLSAPWWEFVLRGVVVYIMALAMIRMVGKRIAKTCGVCAWRSWKLPVISPC